MRTSNQARSTVSDNPPTLICANSGGKTLVAIKKMALPTSTLWYRTSTTAQINMANPISPTTNSTNHSLIVFSMHDSLTERYRHFSLRPWSDSEVEEQSVRYNRYNPKTQRQSLIFFFQIEYFNWHNRNRKELLSGLKFAGIGE
jgi:hypothetical protein